MSYRRQNDYDPDDGGLFGDDAELPEDPQDLDDVAVSKALQGKAPTRHPHPRRPRRRPRPEIKDISPEDMALNEALREALALATSVVSARYDKFRALGVLAWTYEFNEIYPELKKLTSRQVLTNALHDQAMHTCAELLALEFWNDIKLQIVRFSVNQAVGKIRRLLDKDGDHVDWLDLNWPPAMPEKAGPKTVRRPWGRRA